MMVTFGRTINNFKAARALIRMFRRLRFWIGMLLVSTEVLLTVKMVALTAFYTIFSFGKVLS